MGKKVIFSGIQPSGNLHIGNYIGAIQQWSKLQDDSNNELIFCTVDLHAVTVPQDPQVLREKNLELTALYIACGIDPAKSKIFIQSENPDHPYLGWLFDCVTPIGWLNRMTQFKDKSAKQAEATTVGLFNYPPLMAADILLYDTTHVPVGEDQKQHIELTRDIAEKFNKTFGETFVLPEPMIDREAARIMSLQNPMSKMSKSDKDLSGTINLLDSETDVRDKVMKAVTDSGSEVTFGADKPAISNLLSIYSKLSGKSFDELEKQYVGVGYGQFKKDLAEVVVTKLKEIQMKYQELRAHEDQLNQILSEGRDYAIARSSKKVAAVKQAMGLGR
jgi:tryptophanyl-tRNA synthetase